MILSNNINKFIAPENPTIIYDLDVLKEKVNSISKLIPSYINIYYSIKANDYAKILNSLYKNESIQGFEVSSINEYKKVNEFTDKSIGFTGPSFTVREIKNIYINGYVYDFDCIEQILSLGDCFTHRDIGLRINLKISSIESQRKHRKTSRFGFSIKDLDDVRLKELLKKNKLKIHRVHIHNCEKDEETIEEMIEMISYILKKTIGKYVKEINLGGGWNYLYENGQLSWALKKFELFNSYTLIIEPGRLLVNDCGYLVAQVINQRIIDNIQHVTLNVSAYNLLSWFSTFPISNTSKNKKKLLTCLWGNTCYEEDFFVKNHYMSVLKIGDRVLFYPFGAYYRNNNKKLHNLPYPQEVVCEYGRIE